MAYEVVMSYHLHMPSYFLGTFTEYPYQEFAQQQEQVLFGVDWRNIRMQTWTIRWQRH